MNYGWVIDKDHYDGSDVGVEGPRTLTPELKARLDKGEGARFKMYDDDQELVYSGRLVLEEQSEETITVREAGSSFKPGTYLVCGGLGDEEGFGPLWDFGTPNFGCTEIKYREQASGRWGWL